MMRLAHTTMLPHLAPPYRAAVLLNTDSGIWNKQLSVTRFFQIFVLAVTGGSCTSARYVTRVIHSTRVRRSDSASNIKKKKQSKNLVSCLTVRWNFSVNWPNFGPLGRISVADIRTTLGYYRNWVKTARARQFLRQEFPDATGQYLHGERYTWRNTCRIFLLTCPIIPMNAHILNVFRGTLTRYSWKKALMKKTMIDAVFLPYPSSIIGM